MSVEKGNIYREMQQGHFVVSAEINPSSSMDIAVWAGWRNNTGINAYDVNDRPSVESVKAADILSHASALPVIAHIASRKYSAEDMSRLAETIARNEMIRDVLVIGGDMQAGGIGPLTALKTLKKTFSSKGVDVALGATVNQNAADLDKERKSVERKQAAGADFFMSQVVFTEKQVDRTHAFFGEISDRPLVMGVWPITDIKAAIRIYRGKIPGVVLSEHEYNDYLSIDAEDIEGFKRRGIESARKLINYIKVSGVANGIYIVSPRKANDLREVVGRI